METEFDFQPADNTITNAKAVILSSEDVPETETGGQTVGQTTGVGQQTPATVTTAFDSSSRSAAITTSFDTTCPDTITTFDLAGFATHSHTKTSLAVAEKSALTSLKIFKPVFADLTLPYSLVRNEEASLSATVFNYHPAGELEVHGEGTKLTLPIHTKHSHSP